MHTEESFDEDISWIYMLHAYSWYANFFDDWVREMKALVICTNYTASYKHIPSYFVKFYLKIEFKVVKLAYLSFCSWSHLKIIKSLEANKS